MYSASIVDERLEFARQELGFPLEYHSASEIDYFEAQLERKYAGEYARARGDSQGTEDQHKGFQISLMRALCDPANPHLTREESRWMLNERYLVMCDCAYFLTRYYKIKNRENTIQRFNFQAGQKVLFNVIAEMESMRIAIEIICPKARQLGVSTLAAGMELHKVAFTHGVNGVVSSADRKKTGEMVQMMLLAYDMLPWHLRPLTTRRVESDQGMIVFGGQRSAISFQHGNQTNPIAMGSTPIAYHLSEVSSYPNADELIDVGLFKAVHPSPRVFGLLESTCKGDTGWWYDTYWFSKSNWKNRRSRLLAVFLPFVLGTDMYPNPTWIRTRPVPQNWRPIQETRVMMAETELYIKSNEVLAKVLGGNWKFPNQQAWYWECNFLEARSKGKEKLWLQEMPHTDRHAFQGSFDNVFGREVIAEAFTHRTTRYAVYGVIGQSIEARHEPDPEDFDYELPIIPVAYRSRKGETYRWELQPLKWQEDFTEITDLRDADSHMGKLFVYLPPEPGFDYSIGIDTSNGIGSDSTVITVYRRGRNPQEHDEQAAEFRSDRVSHVEAYAWGLCIAAYYKKFMGNASEAGESNSIYSEPFVVVEQIQAVGDTVQLQMSNMGYSRFMKFTRYDSDPKHMRKNQSRKRGWYTNSWSRPILTDTFVTWVINGWVKINSPWTIYECEHWEVHLTGTGKDKFEHSEDTTDDGIFASAMATFGPNDRKTMAERSTKKLPDGASGNLPQLDIGAFRGNLVSVDQHHSPESDRWNASELGRYV